MANSDFLQQMAERKRHGLPGIDMEPLAVINRLIRNKNVHYVGGHIQLAKVYQRLTTIPFVIDQEGQKSFMGRPLAEFENPDRYSVLKLDAEVKAYSFEKELDENYPAAANGT